MDKALQSHHRLLNVEVGKGICNLLGVSLHSNFLMPPWKRLQIPTKYNLIKLHYDEWGKIQLPVYTFQRNALQLTCFMHKNLLYQYRFRIYEY